MEINELLYYQSILFLMLSIFFYLKKLLKIYNYKKEIKKIWYGPLKIYYCTQSGTSANFAYSLKDELLNYNIFSEVKNLDNFIPEEFGKEEFIIFLLSTHYEGDPPDTGKKFLKWIKSEKENKYFSNKKYTIFGFGDKNYIHFNNFARNINKLLVKKGAKQIYDYGEGSNHDGKIEYQFLEWRSQILKIKNLLTVFKEKPTSVNKSLEKLYTISLIDKPLILSSLKSSETFDSPTNIYLDSNEGEIISIKELRQKTTKNTSTLLLQIKSNSSYITGQNISIYPENSEENIADALDYFNLKKDMGIELIYKMKNYSDKQVLPFPNLININDLFSKFIDLNSPIKKHHLLKLIEINDNKYNISILRSYLNEDKLNNINKNYTTMINFFKLTKLKISLINFIEISNKVVPRVYTIASSNKKLENIIEVAISLVCQTNHNNNVFRGLMSQFCYDLFKKNTNNKKVKFFLQNSNFKFPTQNNSNSIMISTGTGIAPFRAFIQEKHYESTNNLESKFGKIILFFGSRNRDEDYIFKDEIEFLFSKDAITAVFEVFSREEEKKIYVQDVISHKKEMFMKFLLENQGNIYICGNLGMSQSVCALIKQFIKEFKNIDENQANNEFLELQSRGRICIEAWG